MAWGISSISVHSQMEGAQRMQLGSFKWCPVPGQEAMSTNCNAVDPSEYQEHFCIVQRESAGTGCPEAEVSSLGISSSPRHPALGGSAGEGVDQRDTEGPGSLSHSVVLWKCERF